MPAHHTAFTTIRIEGAILPPDLLQRIADGDASIEGLSPDAYHLAKGEKINEAINRAWNRVLGAWTAFRARADKLPEGDAGTTITREHWLLPLFTELGYGRLATAKAIEIEGDSYPISHGWQNTPIHLVGLRVDLDTRTKGVAGAARNSPHSLVQILLNRSDAHLWAFVSNGLRLRILRDNKMLTRQAYVEFDLQAMMEGQVYSDFCLLWLLSHQSRVEAERPEECWLEKWSRAAQEQGTRALDQLRGGVEEAISALGRGFLAHPVNRDLRDKLYAGKLEAQDYYRQLLRLVYRLIFLFVAEDRGLLFNSLADTTARNIYSRFYSTAKLRALAERRRGTRHADLYHALRLVMEKLGGDLGCIEIGLPALGGFLFSPQAIPDLGACEIANHDLLDAIRALAFTMDRSARRVVDYKNLGSEELGSVYESLLELHPIINSDAHSFELKTASGNERKTTGSFYTPTPLINCLLDSALDPILDEACRKPNPEQAILALKVCDSAGGSGHIAIAAARRIAKRLATIRTGDEEPSPEAMRTALRDVITHCIYVVDVNPMAVELCKVNLWMEMQDPRYPLSFLDAHIKCGNSLIGVAPGMDISEIPDEAFNPVTGDHKPTASALKKRNKAERAGQLSLDLTATPLADDLLHRVTERARQLNAMPEETATQVQAKGEAYRQFLASEEYARKKLEYDLWTAAFFWQIKQDPRGATILAPTQGELARLRRGERLNPELVRQVQTLAERLRFFHWELEFPEVFEQGGFDANLSNPPWERLNLEEQQFFAQMRPDIGKASTTERRQLIKQLEARDDPIYQQYVASKWESETEIKFALSSGSFPFVTQSRLNTYALFVQRARNLIAPHGRVGLIVPSGVATDVPYKDLFNAIVNKQELVSLYDFENRRFLFPSIDQRYRFCLLTLAGNEVPKKEPEFAFFLYSLDDLDEKRIFNLSSKDLRKINPLTATSPVFRNRFDADLVKKIYDRVPTFFDANEQPQSDWQRADFLIVFRSDSKSDLYKTREDLEREGHHLDNEMIFKGGGNTRFWPVYEAKLIHQFDHRYATYAGVSISDKSEGKADVMSPDAKNSVIISEPRYWASENSIRKIYESRAWIHPWTVGYRDVTNATNERTAIAAILPLVGSAQPLNILVGVDALTALLWVCGMNSLVGDYIARQKIGGIHLNITSCKQLPLPSPETMPLEVRERVIAIGLELTYTSPALKSFATELGYHGKPFRWDEERRAHLRAELDAYYARLYGLTRDELRYILDPKDVYGEDFPGETFRVLKDKEMRQYGEYRTRRLVLEKWDKLELQRNVIERIDEPVQTVIKIPVESGIGKPFPEITWIPISPAISRAKIKQPTPNYRQAVGVAWLLENFGTGQSIPLFDAEKYSYFLQRANLADMNIEFREFARGPYDPQVKYHAGAYANKKSYWEIRGSNIVRKRNMKGAVNAANKVVANLGQAQRLIGRLARMSKEDLGGIATVDFASRAIFERGQAITSENILAYFKSDWQKKVGDPWYTDENINRAVELLSELGLFKKQ